MNGCRFQGVDRPYFVYAWPSTRECFHISIKHVASNDAYKGSLKTQLRG